MAENVELLSFRLLLAMLEAGDSEITMVQLAKKLGEKKYTITRAMDRLEKKELVVREDRIPFLTEKGKVAAEKYHERYMISRNHLLYEGAVGESAEQNACYWAVYCTDEMMDVIRSSDARYRLKRELRDQITFNGDILCEKMSDGTYFLPFIIYRLNAKGNDNISMANEGFENPCALYVDDGKGFIQLKIKEMQQDSMLNGFKVKGKVSKVEYLDNNEYKLAEIHEDVLSIPSSALNFLNLGSGAGQILQGTVCLRMQCSCGLVHMPESEALFSMFI